MYRGMLALLSACTTVANEPGQPVSLDEPAFKAKIEKILVTKCSYLACHGQAGAALRVYAPGLLRAVAPKDLSDWQTPLTADEEHANFLSASAFSLSVTTANDNWLLRKPLPQSLGGYEHKGGAIWTSTNDPDYAAVYCWVNGGKSC